MSTSATRIINITMTGDINSTQVIPAPTNTNAPGDMDIVRLAVGNNTIQVPTGGTQPKAVTIMKKPDNTAVLILKGVDGDTGVKLHATDPDSISLASDQTSFVLNASAQADVRLIWS